MARSVRQEAVLGVLYVFAPAATVLVIDRSPQGAEHVKKMLVGGILSVTADEVVRFIILYSVIGAFHWLVRPTLLAGGPDMAEGTGRIAFSDLVFYLSFCLGWSSLV